MKYNDLKTKFSSWILSRTCRLQFWCICSWMLKLYLRLIFYMITTTLCVFNKSMAVKPIASTLISTKIFFEATRKTLNLHGKHQRKIMFYLYTKYECIELGSIHTFYLSFSTFFPIQLATMGVRATVEGNLIGDAALCAAYAKAKVPTFSPVASVEIPTWKFHLMVSPKSFLHQICNPYIQVVLALFILPFAAMLEHQCLH